MQKEILLWHSYLELQPFETHRVMHHDRGVCGLGTDDGHAV